MTIKLVILQMTPTDTPGHLPHALRDIGVTPLVYAGFRGEYPPMNSFDAITLLGGHHSARALPKELQPCFKLVEQALIRQRVIFGHCLGGQIIAHVLGAEIKEIDIKEIGWTQVTPVGETENNSSPLNQSIDTFEWHGEGFELPIGACHLFQSREWTNQAFSYETALAMQFHLEADAELINSWYLKNGVEQLLPRPELNVIQYQNLRRFYHYWLTRHLQVPVYLGGSI